VTRLTGLMAVTLWFTAPARGPGNAAGAQVAELCDALSKHFTSLFQIRKGIGHVVVPLFRAYYIRKAIAARKRY